MRSVQEARYVLGHIDTKTATNPRVKSRYFLKAKLAVLKIRAHPNNAEIEKILDDISKGEQNRNPTEKQYSIPCPPFWLVNCTKNYCVSKKWWDILPLNNDGTSNHLSVNWSNHFKGLYDTNKIPHLVFNMADNHIPIVYFHHIIKHGGNH